MPSNFRSMNVCASVGWLDGGANAPVIIQGINLMNYVGLGSRCDGGLLEPDMSRRTLDLESKPDFEGESYTLGFNLATGRKKMFVVLPVSYTMTNHQ